MQADALRRAREMQKLSKGPEPAPQNVTQGPAAARSLESVIGGLGIDREKAMIGLLIYILYKQGADVKLLLALGYLLL